MEFLDAPLDLCIQKFHKNAKELEFMNFQMSFETFHATEILKCMLGILVEKQALRRIEVLAHTRPAFS